MTKEEFTERLKKAVEGCKTKMEFIVAIAQEFSDIKMLLSSPKGRQAAAFFYNMFKNRKSVKDDLKKEQFVELKTTRTSGHITKVITIYVQKITCPSLTHLCFYSYQIEVKKKPNIYERHRI